MAGLVPAIHVFDAVWIWIQTWMPATSAGMTMMGSAGQPLDRRAAASELFLQPLETTVEVVDAIDDGFALGGQRRDHQRHRGPQVRCHDRRTLELRDAFNGGALAVEMDARTKPRQLADMHETVFENRLGDVRGAARARRQRHQLRLQVKGAPVMA